MNVSEAVKHFRSSSPYETSELLRYFKYKQDETSINAYSAATRISKANLKNLWSELYKCDRCDLELQRMRYIQREDFS
jgi:hypothetical protein